MHACLYRQIDSMPEGLDGLGIADNAMIMSLSDCGTCLSLIAGWPGRIQTGSDCEDVVDLTDFLPTLCELSGAGQTLRKQRTGNRSRHPQVAEGSFRCLGQRDDTLTLALTRNHRRQ